MRSRARSRTNGRGRGIRERWPRAREREASLIEGVGVNESDERCGVGKHAWFFSVAVSSETNYCFCDINMRLEN